MNLIDYLELPIKSDELIGLFEDYDVDATYSYDRLQEGAEDQYFASIFELGLQFRFNANQLLKTIFVYAQDEDQFQSANLGRLGLCSFENKAEAIDYAVKNGAPYVKGEAAFLGEPRSWVKLSFKSHTLHYEFRQGVLCLVTIQSEIS